jgi:cytochrome P450
MTQWILYELARNAVLQAELREEVSTAQDSPLDVLNQLLLLDAVLLETLRLHPAILENHHEVLPILLTNCKLT